MPFERNARKALDRRVSQLTMDYIYQAVMLLRSRKDLFSHVRLLKTNGLYPLPVRRYTLKYFFFFVARQHLCRTLPSPPPVASDKAGGVSLGVPNA